MSRASRGTRTSGFSIPGADVPRRVTFDVSDFSAVFSADGGRIAHEANGNRDARSSRRRRYGGTGEEAVLLAEPEDEFHNPSDWSLDGRYSSSTSRRRGKAICARCRYSVSGSRSTWRGHRSPNRTAGSHRTAAGWPTNRQSRDALRSTFSLFQAWTQVPGLHRWRNASALAARRTRAVLPGARRQADGGGCASVGHHHGTFEAGPAVRDRRGCRSFAIGTRMSPATASVFSVN